MTFLSKKIPELFTITKLLTSLISGVSECQKHIGATSIFTGTKKSRKNIKNFFLRLQYWDSEMVNFVTILPIFEKLKQSFVFNYNNQKSKHRSFWEGKQCTREALSFILYLRCHWGTDDCEVTLLEKCVTHK